MLILTNLKFCYYISNMSGLLQNSLPSYQNSHINGPENLSVLNMYFIDALIMVLFSSKLKV